MNRTRIIISVAAAAGGALASPNARAGGVDPDSQRENYADVWLRLDADRVAASLWVGGTAGLGPLNLGGNLIAIQNIPSAVDPFQNDAFNAATGDDYRAPSLRLELGPALAAGGFFFLPKLGIGYDFEREKVAPFVPQLMTVIEGGPLYVESWIQVFWYSPFDEGSQDSFYTRDAILLALSNTWAIGPQVELVVALKNGPSDAVRSLPVGVTVNMSPVSPMTFGAFAGFETQPEARNSEHDYFSGRFTLSLLF